MKATIHQPYFIPWLGYFSRLAFSDVYVVLDNVQFRKRHYFDRTKIVNMHGEIRWLSLPVGENFRKACNEVYVNAPDGTYINNLLKTIEFSYAKARFFDQEWSRLREALRHPLSNYSNLVELDVRIIDNITRLLGSRMPSVSFASELVTDCDDATERIISICDELGITSVIVGGGMSLKVHDWLKITNHGVSVYMQDYLVNHPVYEQSRRKRAGFQPGLSIIDAILNVGRAKVESFLVDEKFRPVRVGAPDAQRGSVDIIHEGEL